MGVTSVELSDYTFCVWLPGNWVVSLDEEGVAREGAEEPELDGHVTHSDRQLPQRPLGGNHRITAGVPGTTLLPDR